MSWIRRILESGAHSQSGRVRTAEDVVRFYQQFGFFANSDPLEVIEEYRRGHGKSPSSSKPWDDVYLLAHSEGDVWADDPEADVCAENQVYAGVVQEWGRISKGAFTPTQIEERWNTDTGPIAIEFSLEGQQASVSPSYQEDWIDLQVLKQINALIASSGRQFECAADVNFALVVCLTPEQKEKLRTERNFPFAW